uniref:Uncharacterized protein n=1 Tax=Anguilla anguilla TaxID=7936 RepID=A0A0E9VH32_ANGAN
MVNQARFF